MSDERLRGLARRVLEGEAGADELLREEARAASCVSGCRLAYAGKVKFKRGGRRYQVVRTFCWRCGHLSLAGDVSDRAAMELARTTWGLDYGYSKLFPYTAGGAAHRADRRRVLSAEA